MRRSSPCVKLLGPGLRNTISDAIARRYLELLPSRSVRELAFYWLQHNVQHPEPKRTILAALSRFRVVEHQYEWLS